MGGCSVVGCKSRSERKIDGISFHSFPKVPEKRSIWINATGRQNWIPTRGSKICSLHFDAGCLVFTEKLVLLNAYAEPLPVGHLAKPRSHKRSSLVPSTSQAALKKKHNKLSVDENNRSSCYPVRHSNTGKMAQGTLTEKQDTNNSIIMDNNFMDECRACLQKIVQQTAYNILEPWFTPWAVRGSIIADDLAKLADVEITELDKYPKVICPKCYHCLSDACKFMIKVQRSDSILRERASLIDTLWPQPILVNKTKNTDIDSSIQVEVKQEVLSEDENGPETEQDWEPTMDIKIEPEEIIGARISSGSTSPLLDPLTTEVNGDGSDTESEYDSGAQGHLQVIGDIVIECDKKQKEVQKPRQIVGVRLNKAPKTSADHARELRARKALVNEQSKQQQEPNEIVELASEDIQSAGPSEIIAAKRAKSAEATRRWREKKKAESESSKRRTEHQKGHQAKTAAQRLREYRKRKKMLFLNSLQ